jgi:CheY-like chemotaxis protein
LPAEPGEPIVVQDEIAPPVAIMNPAEESGGRRVLVVDDDWDVQDALAETLQDAGFQVTCATNGEEALTYLYAHALPDAILLDLFMPVMNGWDTVRAIRRNAEFNCLPVIIITASEPYWGYPSGRVLRKPIDAQKLVSTVRDAIAGGPTGPITPPKAGAASKLALP